MITFFYAIVLIASTHAYNHINGRIIARPFYIDDLTPFHTACVEEAVDSFNSYGVGTITYGARFSSNLIQYDNNTSAGTTIIKGRYIGSLNEWLIPRTDILLNPNINSWNTCVNIVLHELCHTRGLHHSNEPGSIMNITIKKLGNQFLDMPLNPLTWNDWVGLYTYN
jgi:hypothetical protein